MRMLVFLLALFVLGDAALHAVEIAKPPAPPQKATAAQLLEDAKRSLAAIGKIAKESNDKSLDPKNLRQLPFWTALKKADESIMHIDEQLQAHDVAFFEALNSGTQIVSELKYSLPRSGIKNPKIDASVKALSNALSLLRRNYGVESLRKNQGAELSEQERAKFAELKEAEKKLAAQLEDLKEQVKSNANLNAELTRLLAQLKKSIDAPFSVDALNSALELVDVIEGEWDAYSYFVEPKNRKAWQNTNVAASLKSVDTIHKDTKREVAVADWSYLEDSIEFDASVDVSVEIGEDEIGGYMVYIEESIDGVDLTVYYEEEMADEAQDEKVDDVPDEDNK